MARDASLGNVPQGLTGRQRPGRRPVGARVSKGAIHGMCYMVHIVWYILYCIVCSRVYIVDTAILGLSWDMACGANFMVHLVLGAKA